VNWPSTVPPALRELIERACTPKEVEVMQLKAQGYSKRGMANILGISEEAVRDRMRRAVRKVKEEAAAQRGVELW
jgi:DNA-binding CsgD family transcriptional regulator